MHRLNRLSTSLMCVICMQCLAVYSASAQSSGLSSLPVSYKISAPVLASDFSIAVVEESKVRKWMKKFDDSEEGVEVRWHLTVKNPREETIEVYIEIRLLDEEGYAVNTIGPGVVDSFFGDRRSTTLIPLEKRDLDATESISKAHLSQYKEVQIVITPRPVPRPPPPLFPFR